ncbi:MAG: hypothetical protein KMY50_00425 [Candidatus Desulforudis sp.]|nr:hypothetical protein [Desulforudis sp.]
MSQTPVGCSAQHPSYPLIDKYTTKAKTSQLPDFFESAREVPITDLLQRYSHVELKQRGNNLWGRCPFHEEKTASFKIDPHKGVFYCFGCHAAGDGITLTSLLLDCSLIEAAKIICDDFNLIPSPIYHPHASTRNTASERRAGKDIAKQKIRDARLYVIALQEAIQEKLKFCEYQNSNLGMLDCLLDELRWELTDNNEDVRLNAAMEVSNLWTRWQKLCKNSKHATLVKDH